METIQYFFATQKDLDLLIDSRLAFLAAFNPNLSENDPTELRKALRMYFESSIREGTYLSWIAKAGGEFAGIGGMVILSKPGNYLIPDGRSGYIMNMYTLPEFRRQGIAATILNKLMESGRKKGVRFFELHASPEGEQIYVRNDFKLHPQPTYRKLLPIE